MTFLTFSTPREVWQKAADALPPLLAEPGPATVFDYFATAYHIFDYAAKNPAIPAIVLGALRNTTDMRVCRDLANKSKHARLDRNRPDPTDAIWSSTLDGAPLDTMLLDGDDQFMVWTEDGEFEVRALAKRVLATWDEFLKRHGL
jgi:hypothetical protein